MKKSVQAQRPRKLTEAQEQSLEKLERLVEIYRSSKHFWEKRINGLEEDERQRLEGKLDRLQQAVMLAKNPCPAGETEGQKPANPLRYVYRDVRRLQRTFWYVWENNLYACKNGGADAREGKRIARRVLRLLAGL